MAMKVNYGFQKAERQRAKQAKKEAKQREKDSQPAGESGTVPADSEPAGDAVDAAVETK